MSYKLCQKIVIRPGDLDASGRMVSNSYCMRPMGHKGPCATEKQPEDSEGK